MRWVRDEGTGGGVIQSCLRGWVRVYGIFFLSCLLGAFERVLRIGCLRCYFKIPTMRDFIYPPISLVGYSYLSLTLRHSDDGLRGHQLVARTSYFLPCTTFSPTSHLYIGLRQLRFGSRAWAGLQVSGAEGHGEELVSAVSRCCRIVGAMVVRWRKKGKGKEWHGSR